MLRREQLTSLFSKVRLMSRFFCLVFTITFFCIGNLHAQNKSPNMEVSIPKSKNIQGFIQELETKTGYNFVYSQDDFKDIKASAISAQKGTLAKVLDKVVKPLGLTYHIQDNYVSISLDKSKNAEASVIAGLANAGVKDKMTGVVKDDLGDPLVGVSVIQEGTTNGTITDIDGNFSLTVPENANVIFKYLGFAETKVKAISATPLDITMTSTYSELDEVVVVGYGEQRKATLTGAVVAIQGSDLAKVSQPSLKSSMLGKVPGIRFQQTNGEPGNDGGTFDIRGFGNPLTIVDGVERPFSQVDPNEIESVTVLKDASASVYGFKGANGVIIIKTKQGTIGKPKISYSYDIGLQSPVKNLQMMNAYDYAFYRNQALMNSGQAPQFTDEELEKYRTGSDPVNYPTTDWYDEAIRSVATKQQHNLNINGGSEAVKYFFSFGYLTQDGILKSSQKFDRYNFRSNVTAKINSRLSAEIGIGGRMEDRKYPYYLGDEGIKVFTALKTNAPNVPVYANNNSKYYYNSDNNELNPMAMLDRDATGYKDRRDLELNTQIALNLDIYKGLSARAFVAFDFTDQKKKELKKELNLYTYDQDNDLYNSVTKIAKGELFKASHPYYKTVQQYSLNYKNKFANNHNVAGLLLFEWRNVNHDQLSGRRYFSMTSAIDELDLGDVDGQEAKGISEQEKYGGYVGRFNYDFAGKYLFEFSFRYDGSYKTSPSKRWGFFPAVSTGWRVSEENFMKNTRHFLDNLKLRASWGKIGDDRDLNASQFMSGWKFPEGNYIFGGGGDGTIIQGIKEANLANQNIFWYKVQTTNVGLDASFWNNKLMVEVDYFYRKTTGKYATRQLSLPTTSGIPLPQENLDSDDNRGFELMLGTAQKVGDVDFQIKGNVAYSRARDLYKEQGMLLNDYLNYKNNNSYRYKNKLWGYVATGQFQSYEEILNAPIQDGKSNSSLHPGDIKYQDLNNDGIIDDLDQKIIGKSAFPDLNYGLTMDASWKGFDLNILFQGAAEYTQEVNAHKNPFRGPGDGNGFEIWRDSWHKADYNNPESAWVAGKFPSLRTSDSPNNSRTSTYWTTDAYYIRLKSIELGYTLPKSILNNTGIDRVRVYANAYNLFTITNVKHTDPEAVEGLMSFYYPQLKTFSFGINVNF